jgi:hypothetical protein
MANAFFENRKRAGLETAAVEGYRTGRLSTYQVQTLLGLNDRWETEAWLAAHDVRQNYSSDDLDADREALRRVLGSPTR